MDTGYLAQQVTTIIGKLHDLFDEIGVPSHERDSRESELFSSLSETLHNHLRLVASEKNELVEEGQRIITVIKQMEASLDDAKTDERYASKRDDPKVTYPLLDCLQVLKEKHRTVSKLHQERYEQVKKLLQALESYSSHLEPAFLQIKLPPVTSDGTVPPTFDLSPSYISSVDIEFTRVFEEYTRRVTTVRQLSEEIVKLWAELGTPQAQTDGTIVKCSRDAPEQLGLHQDDLARLRSRRDKLQEEKRGREKHMKDLRYTVEELWDKLGVEEADRKGFLAGNRGCGLRAINDLEDELSRLNELKRQNLHLFVEDARSKLQNLWDELFFSEEEAVEFTPMFCDVYSDALLSAHEQEITRLETLKEQRAPMLQLVAKHRSLIRDREDLAASSQDASRLLAKGAKGEKRDPTRLLREEKMRKRIAKELPRVEQELHKVLESWEEEYGRPWLVFGERYLDVVAEASAKAPAPRSKTPNGMGPPPRPTRSVTTTQKTPASRNPSREPATLRSKTPVGTGTISRTQPGSSKPASGIKSPSKIPSRVPLGNMPHGGNSPERHTYQSSGKENGTSCKIGQPTMAPPPKMREFAPPFASTPSSSHPTDVPGSASVVRQVAPEDPYSDHQLHRSYLQASRSQYSNPQHANIQQPHNYHTLPPPARPTYYNHDNVDFSASSTASTVPSSRQISAASSVATNATTVSGSENWEAYDDDDAPLEPEPDASNAYYAKLHVATGKRFAPDDAGPHMSSMASHHQGKKMKPFREAGETYAGAGNVVDGGDAGWADTDLD